MKFVFLVLSLMNLATSSLYADMFLLPDAINPRADIAKLNYDFFEKTMKYPALRKRGLMECVELTEPKNALLCASSKQELMNRAFSRAALFSEGTAGVPKGTVHDLDSKPYLEMLTSMGHDIPSKELLDFWDVVQQNCECGATCPSAEEKELFEKIILPFSAKRDQFAVITYSLDGDWMHALSHELMHAQYFLDERFRNTVDTFWSETVSAEDRAKVVELLGTDYNSKDGYLMRNEFQAFLLDIRASVNVFKDLVPKYQEALIKKLAEAGVEPIRAK